MRSPRINNRIRYNRQLQKERSSFLYKIFAAAVVLGLVWLAFSGLFSGEAVEVSNVESDSSKAKMTKEIILEEENELEDVKRPEMKVVPLDVDFDSCQDDQEHLLDHNHKSCKHRIEMLQHMGKTCEDDPKTAKICCRSCRLRHLTQKHAYRKRDHKGEETDEVCLDHPELFQHHDPVTDVKECKDILNKVYKIGVECNVVDYATKDCCHSCVDSPLWDDNVCEDQPEFLEDGDCNLLFKNLAMRGARCSGFDESRYCCQTCKQLDSLYGEAPCVDKPYMLQFGTCKDRVTTLQRLGKTCDDDAEVAEVCCRSCSPHLIPNQCHDSLFKIDGKTCAEAVEERGVSDYLDHPCEADPELQEKCCRSCDPERCDDTMELIDGNSCKQHVKLMKALGKTCNDHVMVKEKCCHSCSKFFPE